jgi:hypothetical protein
MSGRDSDRWLVPPGTPLSLKDRDPRDTTGAPGDMKATKEALDELAFRLEALQDRLYAESRQSLLVVSRRWTPAARTARSSTSSAA